MSHGPANVGETSYYDDDASPGSARVVLIAAVAAVWLAERLFEFKVLPF